MLIFLIKKLKHGIFSTEFERRKTNYFFIPRRFQKIKRKQKVYEEIQYLSQGYKKFLSYSTWDKMSRMIYHVDVDGKMNFEKLNLKEERLDILMNPLLGPLLRRTKDLPENVDLEKK